MRVFGREVDSCQTDLDIALGPLDAAAVGARIAKLEAKNNARTPIGASLEKVADDLRGASGERLVILLTDGEETCGGDPAAAIAKLRKANIGVRVNIVGFAIDDEGAGRELPSLERRGRRPVLRRARCGGARQGAESGARSRPSSWSMARVRWSRRASPATRLSRPCRARTPCGSSAQTARSKPGDGAAEGNDERQPLNVGYHAAALSVSTGGRSRRTFASR